MTKALIFDEFLSLSKSDKKIVEKELKTLYNNAQKKMQTAYKNRFDSETDKQDFPVARAYFNGIVDTLEMLDIEIPKEDVE